MLTFQKQLSCLYITKHLKKTSPDFNLDSNILLFNCKLQADAENPLFINSIKLWILQYNTTELMNAVVAMFKKCLNSN